jgi:hypothetical protein
MLRSPSFQRASVQWGIIMRITTLLTLVCALAVSLAFTSQALAADRSFMPDEDGQIVFVTPSRNIGCTYIPKGGSTMYTPDDGGPELGCDRIKPKHVRLILSAAGKAFIFEMEGDSGCCSDVNVLNYGERWHTGPFSCQSDERGLTCRRKDGHGFFASRKTYTVD